MGKAGKEKLAGALITCQWTQYTTTYLTYEILL